MTPNQPHAHIHTHPAVTVEYLGNNIWSVVVSSITTTNPNINTSFMYLPSVCYTIHCQVEFKAPRFQVYLSHVTQAMADQRGNLGPPCSIPFTLTSTNKALILAQVIPAFAERWFLSDVLPTPNRDNNPASQFVPPVLDPDAIQRDIDQLEAMIADADATLSKSDPED